MAWSGDVLQLSLLPRVLAAKKHILVRSPLHTTVDGGFSIIKLYQPYSNDLIFHAVENNRNEDAFGEANERMKTLGPVSSFTMKCITDTALDKDFSTEPFDLRSEFILCRQHSMLEAVGMRLLMNCMHLLFSVRNISILGGRLDVDCHRYDALLLICFAAHLAVELVRGITAVSKITGLHLHSLAATAVGDYAPCVSGGGESRSTSSETRSSSSIDTMVISNNKTICTDEEFARLTGWITMKAIQTRSTTCLVVVPRGGGVCGVR